VAIGACICLLGAGAAGCSTTQEKAAAKKVEAEKILKARDARQKAKQRAKHKHHDKHGRRAEKR